MPASSMSPDRLAVRIGNQPYTAQDLVFVAAKVLAPYAAMAGILLLAR